MLKSVRACATNKPWLTGEVCLLLRTCNAAFKSCHTAAYKEAKNKLKRGKKTVWRNLVRNFDRHRRDTGCLWQGFQAVTGCKPTFQTAHCNEPSLPDDLNGFYSRFKVTNTRSVQRLMPPLTKLLLRVLGACTGPLPYLLGGSAPGSAADAAVGW